MIESVVEDVRLALRGFAKTPGFTVVVILTLAVAIGANTAIFSVVDAVLLRPLPYPDADEIVVIGQDRPGFAEFGFSDTSYPHFGEKNRTLEALGAYQTTRMPLTGSGEPIELSVGVITNSLYAVLGVAALRGRLPSEAEDVPAGPLVAVLSQRLWVARFASDPDVIGRTIQLDDRTREVIGIMPAEFAFPTSDIDLWIPLQRDPASQNVGLLQYRAVGRLRADVTIESATADAQNLRDRLGEAGFGPEWFTRIFTGPVRVRTLKEHLIGDTRQLLLIVLGAVSFVLLIACANVANLFLVRADGRVRQTAVRAALGATRLRLVQQVLTEGVLLALIGGVGGLVLAQATVRLLVAIAPASIPRLDEVGMSATVFLYTAGVSVLVGLLFALVPAMPTGSSARVRAALTDGGRGSTTGRDRLRLRGILVVSQVALALVLLIGSGLMVRSFRELSSVDPGFESRGIVTFSLRPPPTRYPAEAIPPFFDQLLERVRAMPGVEAAGAAAVLPLRPTPGFTVAIEEFPTADGDFPPVFAHNWVTPGYFETMRIPVVAGRTMEPADHQQRLGTLFISDSIVAQYWPSTSALGKRVRSLGRSGEVAGVVRNVRSYGLDAPPAETIYMPIDWPRPGTSRAMSVVVRTSGDPADLIPLLRGEVAALDDALPLGDIEMMDDVVAGSGAMSRTSFTTFLLGLAAFVAVLLGSVGIYGVISYVVSQRTAELGIRVALGARSTDIRSQVLRRGMAPAVIGIILGVGSAALMSRLLTSFLFEVDAYDPLTFIAAPIAFLLIAFAACVLPTRRATRIDPATALRSD